MLQVSSRGLAVGQAEVQLALSRAKIVSEVRAVLTPEQQAEAREMLADARAFGQGPLRAPARSPRDPLAGI
jgi:hypothetical protein